MSFSVLLSSSLFRTRKSNSCHLLSLSRITLVFVEKSELAIGTETASTSPENGERWDD